MSQLQCPGTQALRKGRYSQTNGVYFITVVTDQRIPWFQEHDLARVMCRVMENPAVMKDSENLCWVVMPDHIHHLLRLGKRNLSQAVKGLKANSALKLNSAIGRKGRFWSPGFYDHGLRKQEDMLEIARYMVANPIRAGLVRRVALYPYWNAVWL